jgi:hypothetical protein
MKEIYVVLGFFLLIGLLIFRMIEEHREEVRRPESQGSRASQPLEREASASAATPSSADPSA